MELTFGERLPGLTADGRELHAAVFDENEVRAAAGLTMVIGAVAFSFAYFDANYLPLQIVTTFFFVEFLIRVTTGLRYSPMGLVAAVMTRSHPPQWVSAKPKRFAWSLGLGMSFAMMVITNSGIRGWLPQIDLPGLPDADVDGVGARRVPRLQAPRAARPARRDDEGPRVRGLRPRRLRAAGAGARGHGAVTPRISCAVSSGTSSCGQWPTPSSSTQSAWGSQSRR